MAEIKEIVEKSKKVLEELEERVEDATEGMSEEAKETWSEIRSNFTAIGEKLKNALNMEEKKEDLASKLEVIEAKEKLVKIKEGAEAFTDKVAQKTEEEIDMAALRAHLAKEEAEELWEEKPARLHAIHFPDIFDNLPVTVGAGCGEGDYFVGCRVACQGTLQRIAFECDDGRRCYETACGNIHAATAVTTVEHYHTEQCR